ncbi:uncharacterized protein WCC33_017622 [Rhinophrynus dorsalis]
MQSEGCRMSGEVQGPAGARMITLDDLDNMPDELGSDSAYNSNGSIEEEAEPMEDGDQDRLLNYWQSIGRGHQVEVPNEMAEPIQQLTRNRAEERQQVPFLSLGRKEKCGEVLYEKRQYEKAKWACIKMNEERYEQSICLGFMKLMRYICEQNSSGHSVEPPMRSPLCVRSICWPSSWSPQNCACRTRSWWLDIQTQLQPTDRMKSGSYRDPE